MYRNPHYSEPLTARISGPMACFTRPEHRTERLSNIVASHAGWEGCLQSVMGHQGSHYQIDRVELLFHPRWRSITSNEVKDFGNGTPINTDKVRTLRTTTFLCGEPGVDFLISFRLMAESPSDLKKYRRMLIEDRFGLRLSKDDRIQGLREQDGEPVGVRYFRQPVLGLRELIANVEPVLDRGSLPKTVDFNMPLGLCYYGRDWTDPLQPNYFTELSVLHGVCEYPSWDAVRRNGIRRGAV